MTRTSFPTISAPEEDSELLEAVETARREVDEILAFFAKRLKPAS